MVAVVPRAGAASDQVADEAPVTVGREVSDLVWVLIMAGIPTGVIVAGLGSRLAMLVLRLTSPESVRGLTSDDGFEIGRFTLGGTYNLLILGAIVGVIGVVAYWAVKPWLLGPGWFRRLAVALASGVVVGSMLVHADGIDFHVLKPLWLAIGLFVALPALFGASIAVAVDRVSAIAMTNGWRRWIVPVVLVAAFPFVIPFVLFGAAGAFGGVLLRPVFPAERSLPMSMRVAVRAGWLALPILGLVALVADIGALT